MDATTIVDIAVVGGGPAGLTAATIAAQAGASVLVLDRESWLGGLLGLQSQPLQGPGRGFDGSTGPEIARALRADAVEAGVEILQGANVASLSHLTNRLWALTLNTLDVEFVARSVVLATGSTEPLPEFDGSDLTGVMLAGEAQAALNSEGRMIGYDIVIAGSDNSGLLIAQNLFDAGANVIAVVDESPEVQGREFNAAPLIQRGVAMLTSTRVVCAIGDDRLERIRVRRSDDDDPDHDTEIEADTLLFALPRSPDTAVAELAGCPPMDVEVLGGSTPVHDSSMATTLPGLFVCGDAAGVESGAVALESGRIAGIYAASYVGHDHPDASTIVHQARGRLGFLRRGRRGGHRRSGKLALYKEHRRTTQSTVTT